MVKRRERSLNAVGILVTTAVMTISVMVGAVGCGSEPACGVEPETLDGSDVVLAVALGGGFADSAVKEFFWSRHGTSAVYVYGDGRFVFLDESDVSPKGYRVYRQGRLFDDDFRNLVCAGASLSADDGGDFNLCGPLDGPTEKVAVNIGTLHLESSAWASFDGSTDCLPDGPTAARPVAVLVNLVNSLFELATAGGSEIVTDTIMLGGNVVPSSAAPSCTVENAVEWPFPTVTWPTGIDRWSVHVGRESSAAVRDFVRANLSDQKQEYQMACVKRDASPYLVYYDDILPDETDLPFQPE